MEEMYQQYAKPVYYFLLSLSHSPEMAEELTAETFYQAIRSMQRPFIKPYAASIAMTEAAS